MPIHQIYATHCTYGSSAVERRKGEFADRVMGYSARASSLSQEELRKLYRTFERFIYYHLPSDFPAEQKPHLSPYDAPRRLIYCPSVSGFQLVGQVGYRQWDVVKKRAGSYFGHLLVQPRDNGKAASDNAWSVLDCLRTWQSPRWQMEDDDALGHDLPPLGDLDELHHAPAGTQPPVLDDDVFLAFLTAPPGADFGYGGELIPPRWRCMPPEKRREVFHQVLCGYLQVAPSKRDSLLLVVEPSIAALLFYGIARLMPPGELREEISFSTFEANADRLVTTLAAVTFHNEDRGDVPQQRYQRGFVLNTFLDKASPQRLRDTAFADAMLQKLASGGFAAADRMLAAFVEAGAEKIDDLTEFARAETTVLEILDPAAAISDRSWRQSPRKVNYLQKSVRGFLDHGPKVALLNNLLASPDHLLAVLELVAYDGAAGPCESAARYLAQRLPAELYGKFVAAELIAPRFKIDGLVAYVIERQGLPPDCHGLWTHGAPPPLPGKKPVAPLPTQLLSRLTAPMCRKLLAEIPANDDKSRRGFLVALIEVAAGDDDKLVLAADIIGEMSEHEVAELLKEHLPRLKAAPSGGRFPLGNRLLSILHQLPEEPREFTRRLALVKSGRELLPASREMLDAWLKFDAELRSFKQQAAPSEGMLGKRKRSNSGPDPDEAGKKLCVAADDGFTQDRFVFTEEGCGEKVTLVRALIEELGGKEFIPSDFNSKAKHYFWYHNWPLSKFKFGRGKGFGLLDAKFIFAGVAAGVVIAAIVLLLNNMQAGSGDDDNGAAAATNDGEKSKSPEDDPQESGGGTAKNSGNEPKDNGDPMTNGKTPGPKSNPEHGGTKNGGTKNGGETDDNPPPKETNPKGEPSPMVAQANPADPPMEQPEPEPVDAVAEPPNVAGNDTPPPAAPSSNPTDNEPKTVEEAWGDPVYASNPISDLAPRDEDITKVKQIVLASVDAPYEIHLHGVEQFLQEIADPNEEVFEEANSTRTDVKLNVKVRLRTGAQTEKIAAFFFEDNRLKCAILWQGKNDLSTKFQHNLQSCVVELRPGGAGKRAKFISLRTPLGQDIFKHLKDRVSPYAGDMIISTAQSSIDAGDSQLRVETLGPLYLGRGFLQLRGGQHVQFGPVTDVKVPALRHPLPAVIDGLGRHYVELSTTQTKSRIDYHIDLAVAAKKPDVSAELRQLELQRESIGQNLEATRDETKTMSERAAAWHRLAGESGNYDADTLPEPMFFETPQSKKTADEIEQRCRNLVEELRKRIGELQRILAPVQPAAADVEELRDLAEWVSADIYRIVKGNEGQQIRVLVMRAPKPKLK